MQTTWMKNLANTNRLGCVLLLSLVSAPVGLAGEHTATPWQHPLYLGHGDFWRQRVPVAVQNDSAFDLQGDPITLQVGAGGDELPLQGVSAESFRVTNAFGDQLLFRLTDSDGFLVERGLVPAGAQLTIPLENGPGEESIYYVYFDNVSAWAVGEYFNTHLGIDNGGFEASGPHGLRSWELEWPETERDVVRSETAAHSGQNSLMIWAESPGVQARYGGIQSGIHLVPGVVYELEAWFRTTDLDGPAGLELNPADLGLNGRSLHFDPVRLVADPAADGWSRTRLEFTAPEKSNTLQVSTFIEGTGRFWVDDIRLTAKVERSPVARVLPVETAPVSSQGATDQWLDADDSGTDWPVRAAVTVSNLSAVALVDHPVYVDILQLRNRLFREVDEDTPMRVTDGVEPIPHLAMGTAVLFKQDIPASTVRTFYLYFGNSKGGSGDREADAGEGLDRIATNLVANPGFADVGLAGWGRFGETPSKQLIQAGTDGKGQLEIRYAETNVSTVIRDIEVSHADPESAVGLYQEFEVEPGRTYFFSSRVKSSHVLNGTDTLRARFLDASGAFTGEEESLKIIPDRHSNDTWMHERLVFQAPPGSQAVRLELLNAADGSVFYDDVFFMGIGNGYTGALEVERWAERTVEGLAVWTANPIAKVFPDDLPDRDLDGLAVSAARNDTEPIQVLFRSREALQGLEVRVDPLGDGRGHTLDAIEVGIVGYVPINAPSNYYRDYETPHWRTKLPVGKVASDGWVGWWPDPILPTRLFDLPPDRTTAVWIELSVPTDAVAGDYTGEVEVIQNGSVLKSIPLSLRVYGFTLPEAPSVKATYVPRFNEREMFGRERTERENREEIWDLMARHKISPDMIKPQPTWTVEDGEVILDFTEFDRAAARYFDEMNFTSTWSPRDLFYLFGWGHPPREKFGEKPYPGESPYLDVDHSKLRPEFKRAYQSALRQYWEHMQARGWADKVVIYISDEPHGDEELDKQLMALCDMIHEVDPEIRIYVSTWWYRPEYEGYVDVWGVSHRGGGWGHPVLEEHLRTIVENGGEIFYTTDGMQCTDTPFLAFERMLPYFCFKYGASEYEFWAANWHTLDPYRYGWHRFHRQSSSPGVWYWMRYPNGDGTMIYPGQPVGVDGLVSSTRLKLAREGVEDYEFMVALERLIDQRDSEGVDTTAARQALDRARDLVTLPAADGRYTTGYTPDPDELMEIRDGIATAIEALAR